jgi:NAD(P)-dependent dehydrogenase (short-subunit alcohol dehydrogenase family)
VGYQLSKLLYAKNATVYIAGRREDVGQDAIKSLKAAHTDSKGRLEFLQLDLADLPSIKASANAFLGKETRLDILWNNAGIMCLPKNSPKNSKQVGCTHFLLVNMAQCEVFTRICLGS